MAAHPSDAWRGRTEQAASPKSPGRGISAREKPMVGIWDSSNPICLGIAESSRHGMKGEAGASYQASVPHAPMLNILCRKPAGRSFPTCNIRGGIRQPEKPNEIGHALVFHSTLNTKTFRILSIMMFYVILTYFLCSARNTLARLGEGNHG
jgi:hypothetical protein